MSRTRKKAAGFQIIQFLGLMMLVLMASALSIDFGFYYAAQNQMQTGADAAALAAASELYHSTSVDPADRQDDARIEAQAALDQNMSNMTLGNSDVVFGYVDPATKLYSQGTFRTSSTNSDLAYNNGYNAVWVRVRKGSGSANSPLTTIMANLFGIRQFNAEAVSVALLDQSINSITNGGLRPIYACEAQLTQAMQDGIPQNNVIRIYGDRMEVDGVGNLAGCPSPGSGNWGFADLRDGASGAPGNNTLGEWWENGYDGTVTVGNNYSTQPGNAISSNNVQPEIQNLIDNHTVITIPLYDQYSGNGSNTSVRISSFAGFVITDFEPSGSANNRYIEGYFTRRVCTTGCGSTGSAGTSPGSAVVKLRLASKT